MKTTRAGQRTLGLQQSCNATKALLAAILALLVASCGSGIQETSKLKHELDKPVNYPGGYLWQEMNDEIISSVMKPLVGMMTGQDADYLPDNHAFAKKAQNWLNKFHDELSKRYPEELKDIPRPIAKIIVDESPNAFVAPIPVCYNVPSVWQEKKSVARSGGGVVDKVLVALGLKTATVHDVWVSPDGFAMEAWNRRVCIERDMDQALVDYVAWFSKNNGGCQLSIEDGSDFGVDAPKVVHIGEGCKFDDALLVSGDKSKRFVMTPTAGMVHFNSGLASMMNEEEFVSVATHELGHYYRGHVVVNEALGYEFFYKLGRENGQSRPEADKSLQEFGEKLKKLDFVTRPYRNVDGQKLRSELFMPAVVTATTIAGLQNCDEGDCNEKCAELGTLIKSEEWKSAIGDFPLQNLEESGVEAYQTFEKDFLACAAEVKVTKEGSKDGSALSSKLMKRSLAADVHLAGILGKTEMQDTVLATIEAGNALVIHAEEESVEPLKQAHEMKLGYYTTEQEADEISIEWMLQVGLSPQHAINAELALGEFIEKMYNDAGVRPYPVTFGMDECRKLHDADWMRDGQYVHVPIGDFSDTHHSSCYRAFNLAREVEAHKFQMSSAQAVAAVSGDDVTWQDVQAELKSAHAELAKAKAAEDNGAVIDRMLRRAEFKTSKNPLERKLHGCPFFGNL